MGSLDLFQRGLSDTSPEGCVHIVVRIGVVLTRRGYRG
jgi:hypothetical protein